jgi:replicative DNA helicase
MSRGAKLLARELGIPVLMLSQLNRSLEQRPNKRPVNSDLRESGAIEQDADVIMFVYRDEIYHENSEYKGIAEVIIGKGRDIETGTVRAAFIGQYNRFENLAAGWVEPDQDSAPANSKVTSMTGRYAKKDKF